VRNFWAVYAYFRRTYAYGRMRALRKAIDVCWRP
jgi:hypothetical protein